MAGVPGQHLPVGHGGTGILLRHGHALAVPGVPANGGVHGAGVVTERAVAHRVVDPGEGPVLQLGGQGLVGFIILRGDDEAAGVLVDAVDDAGPQLAAHPGEGIPAVGQQGVHQRAVRVAGGGVDHQAPGLVHHDHVVILIDHVQGDVLGLGFGGRGLGQYDLEYVSGGGAVVFPHGRAPEGHQPRFQKLRRGGAAADGLLTGEESVDPLPALLCLYRYFRFHQLSRNSAKMSSRE